MPDYKTSVETQAYLKLFNDLLTLGWDFPAKNAEALIEAIRGHREQTLEERLLVTRYLRGMGYQEAPGT